MKNVQWIAALVAGAGSAGVAAAQGSGETSLSGYDDIPTFESPASVAETIKGDNKVQNPIFGGTGDTFGPYYDWKARLYADHGFAFGIDYTALYYGASDAIGDDTAGSGDFRVMGSWTAVGRGTENNGSLIFKAEHQHRFFADIPVNQLGGSAGYIGTLGPPFGDDGFLLTNLFWRQKFNAGRVNLVAGQVDNTDFVDVYGLMNPWGHFGNAVFSTGSGAMPVPAPGLGAAASFMLTDQVYIQGGVADANGDPSDAGQGFDTFFTDNEYFSHVELGWSSSFEERHINNAHLTYWNADGRQDASVASGWGLNGSVSCRVGERWIPFLRAGYADNGGAALQRSVSVGAGTPMRDGGDFLGLGFNWGQPSDSTFVSGLSDQYTAEAFYRMQLTQNFALTPDFQWVVDPALTTEDSIYFLGLRARLAF